jgi:hypothetical protein
MIYSAYVVMSMMIRWMTLVGIVDTDVIYVSKI